MSEQAAGTQLLIVDDDAIMGELLDALLTVEGYRVTRASLGEEALEVVRAAEFKPDVILFDIHMPGMHGGELAEALLRARDQGALPPSTVFVAMSGSAPRAEESQASMDSCVSPLPSMTLATALRGHGSEARGRWMQRLLRLRRWRALPDRRRSMRRFFEQLRSKIGLEPLRQLYDMTLEDVRARVERIAAAAERGDQTVIKHEAHTIKGSCGMVGALDYRRCCCNGRGFRGRYLCACGFRFGV